VHWIVVGLGSREVYLLLPTSSSFLFMMGVVEDCKSFEDVVDDESYVFWSGAGGPRYCKEISIETGYLTGDRNRITRSTSGPSSLDNKTADTAGHAG
jgi:hypothetical protein